MSVFLGGIDKEVYLKSVMEILFDALPISLLWIKIQLYYVKEGTVQQMYLFFTPSIIKGKI